jgi:polysaccharide biosynthesis/export protein
MVHAKTLFLAAVLSLPLLVSAQTPSQAPREKGEDPLLPSQTKGGLTITQPAGVALESTIDPRKYFVGPSDVIAVNVWASPPISFTLTVTPEGTLIVPTVGEVPVSGYTLAEVKERVIKAVRGRYLRADATVTLVVPRPIVVHVVGNVLNPGLFTLSAADRTGKALERANEPLVAQRSLLPFVVGSMSTRNIRVSHRDGTTIRVDLPMYMATHNERYNPFLREGDVIAVAHHVPETDAIAAYGQVTTPGRFEYIPGDSLSTLVALAQGIATNALIDSVLLFHLSKDGATQTTESLDLSAILAGKLPDRLLVPGDRLVVPERIELRRDYRISITGEVEHPGMYPVTRDATRLSEAIRLAGGFTRFASVKDAQLIRRTINPADIDIETLESSRGGINPDDSTYYSLESRLRIRKEIVAVDFERLFVQRDTTQDVYLHSEDYINVPTRKLSVYVFGQVVTNGFVPFVEGQRLEYYVVKAGGFTGKARTGDVRIVKGRSRQWLEPRETEIEAGDYVWVPREIERSFAYYMNILGQTASVVSVAVSVILLILQLNK